LVAEIRALCKARNTNIKSLELALGFGNGTIRKWDVQSPSLDRVLKVADYFCVDVSDLTGERQKEKSPVGITDEADVDVIEMAKLFKQLSPEARKRELAYLRSLSNDPNT